MKISNALKLAVLCSPLLTLPSSLSARGTFEPHVWFIRGDINQDSRVDLSDAQTLFSFLFLGGGEMVSHCQDAADANDDGAIDLTDGVRVLNFLFLGELPPVTPGPTECGTDPSIDLLGCKTFAACAETQAAAEQAREEAVRAHEEAETENPAETDELEITPVDDGTSRFPWRREPARDLFEGVDDDELPAVDDGEAEPILEIDDNLENDSLPPGGVQPALPKWLIEELTDDEVSLDGLRSVDGGEVVAIRFFNPTNDSVELLWVGFDGELVPYQVIEAEGDFVAKSFAHQAWAFRQDGVIIGTYTANSNLHQSHWIRL